MGPLTIVRYGDKLVTFLLTIDYLRFKTCPIGHATWIRVYRVLGLGLVSDCHISSLLLEGICLINHWNTIEKWLSYLTVEYRNRQRPEMTKLLCDILGTARHGIAWEWSYIFTRSHSAIETPPLQTARGALSPLTRIRLAS